LVAAAGGVLGVGLAWIPLRVVQSLIFEIASQESDLSPLRIDGRVILFSALLALASVILSGLWPALHITRQRLNFAPRPRRLWGRNLVVAFQVAAAFVVLTATGTIFGWIVDARKGIDDAGFDTSHITAITFDPLVKRFRADQARHFY